jgi:phosphoribosylamine--glycine ligase
MVRELGGEVAVKPAGLTSGKGVKVVGVQLRDGREAEEYARQVIEKSIGGTGAVLVEEKLSGEEFTLQAFVSAGEVVAMPAVQDHKLAFEGDKGPNTGGMGSYSDSNHLLPFLTEAECLEGELIMCKAVSALQRVEGVSYCGVLYGQFMLTRKGPMLIEFNARFGDPEAMNVLSILESDYVELLEKMAAGSLSGKDASFARKATVCKYIVPSGYPDSPAKGALISVDREGVEESGARLYYGAVNEGPDGRLAATGSRSLAVVGVSDSIQEAEKTAELACSFISGDVWHRSDIGTRGLVERRVEHMKRIRGS